MSHPLKENVYIITQDDIRITIQAQGYIIDGNGIAIFSINGNIVGSIAKWDSIILSATNVR